MYKRVFRELVGVYASEELARRDASDSVLPFVHGWHAIDFKRDPNTGDTLVYAVTIKGVSDV